MGLLTIPKFQLSVSASSRIPSSLSGVCMAAGRTVWFILHLGFLQISCFTLSLKCFSSDPDICSHVGIRPLLHFFHPSSTGLVPLPLLFALLIPSSYRDFWFHTFFSASQVLLSFLSRRSASTSISEPVFLMCPYSMDILHVQLSCSSKLINY